MTIALIADIHANLPALEAVLEDIDRRQPDGVYCLGDLVGYNIWPNEVVQTIRKRRIPTIAGNHDLKLTAYTGDGTDTSLENPKNYAYQIVGKQERNYLLSLPGQLRIRFQHRTESMDILLVHGSPTSVNEYLYEEMEEDFIFKVVEDAGADILCFGHTHKPYHRILNSMKEGRNHFRHAINVGAVGKPKDGDPRACYVLLHFTPYTNTQVAESLTVEFVRVEYDVEKAARAVESSPLPHDLADRLRKAY